MEGIGRERERRKRGKKKKKRQRERAQFWLPRISGRFVAAMRKTPFLASTPSISVSSWLTTRDEEPPSELLPLLQFVRVPLS